MCQAQFTQDVEHLATQACKLWNILWSMRVFTQLASNIKGFAHKFCMQKGLRVLCERAVSVSVCVRACVCNWLVVLGLSCRRVLIAKHFGEKFDAAQCNNECDHCNNSGTVSVVFLSP